MPMRETDQAGEVLMPVPNADALQQVEIHVLRQMGDNIAAQTRSLERLTGKVDDVRERVIRLEEQKVSDEVNVLKADLKAALARIDQLESQRDQAKGAASVWGWLSKNAPWLWGILAGAAVALGFKTGVVK